MQPTEGTTPSETESELREIYNEMRTRQLKAIQNAGTLRSDSFFVPDAQVHDNTKNEKKEKSTHHNNIEEGDAAISDKELDKDERRCLAVSSIISEKNVEYVKWTPAYHELMNLLKSEFAEYGLVFEMSPPKVGGGQLHWTLLQLVGFADYETEVMNKHEKHDKDNQKQNDDNKEKTEYLSEDYVNMVEDSLRVGGLDHGIQIKYVGVILVSTGLLMVGIPQNDDLNINRARDALRENLQKNNYPIKEPFVNDIVHSTLFRVCGKHENLPKDLHLRLMKVAQKYENVDLGLVILNKFQIGPASWRVLPQEIKETPAIREWELNPYQNPENKFIEAIVEKDAKVNSTFTVSGATAHNLAKEVRRQVLLNRQNSSNEQKESTTTTGTEEATQSSNAAAAGAGVSTNNTTLPLFQRPITPPSTTTTDDNNNDVKQQTEKMKMKKDTSPTTPSSLFSILLNEEITTDKLLMLDDGNNNNNDSTTIAENTNNGTEQEKETTIRTVLSVPALDNLMM